MDTKNKLNLKSFVFILLLMCPMVLYIKYLNDIDEEEMSLFGDTTIGVTFKYTTGKNSFIHYCYKVNGQVYNGVSIPGKGQYPGFYYKVIYSTKNPEKSSIDWNESIPDSIGKKNITLNECK